MSEEYVGTLDASLPKGTDKRNQAAAHMRTIKQAQIDTWPNLTGAVTATHTELSYVDGILQHTDDLQLLSCTTSANVWTVTSNSSLSAYAAGQRFCIQVDTASVTSQTLNIDSIGAADVIWPHGYAIQEAEIPADAVIEVLYDGTDFQVIKL